MKTSIGNRIRDRRKELKLTQNQIAKALEVSRVSVTKWENGETKPDGENLYLLTKVLGCDIEWLLYGKDSHSNINKKLSNFSFSNVKSIPILSWHDMKKWDGTTPITEIKLFSVITNKLPNIPINAFLLPVPDDKTDNIYAPPSIPNRTWIIVDPDYGDFEDLNGKIILIQLENSKEPTIKKLSIDGPNKYLIPINPSFKIIELEGNYKVIGNVINIIQNLE
ncbi:MAG TPA: helix-turn-helix domain-containing protein [Arsenophonus nasoniae]|uniref:helix-turn-helix domain-containing protein n=1 Tax=Arsenophonus nasoniae TaxID=638 RepID=UPI00387A6CB5